MQKARCHPAPFCVPFCKHEQMFVHDYNRSAKRCGAPTYCTHHISETVSSPFRGAFHLSLTVLSAIDLCICLALEGGPPRFRPDFTCPTVLRNPLPLLPLSSTGLSPSMAARSRVVRLEEEDQRVRSYNPPHKCGVWAFPLSLATTRGISFDFFSPVTEMFQFTELPSRTFFHARCTHEETFIHDYREAGKKVRDHGT